MTARHALLFAVGALAGWLLVRAAPVWADTTLTRLDLRP